MTYVPLSETVNRARKSQVHDPVARLDLSDVNLLGTYTRHKFPREGTSTLERLEVNGRKGRRVVCVLDQDNVRYRVFDLDSSAGGVDTNNDLEDDQRSSDAEAMSE